MNTLLKRCDTTDDMNRTPRSGIALLGATLLLASLSLPACTTGSSGARKDAARFTDSTGPWVLADVGRHHTCALDREGAAWCWGTGRHGELGDGRSTASIEPVRVLGSKRWRTITTGNSYTCALDQEGAAWCWGSNANRRLGTGSKRHKGNQPRPVPVETKLRFAEIEAGDRMTCGRTKEGKLHCWGYLAKVLDGARPSPDLCGKGGETRDAPVPVLPKRTFTSLVADSSDYMCALDASKQGWCWTSRITALTVAGRSRKSCMMPQRLRAPEPIKQLLPGERFVFGLSASGQVFQWFPYDWGRPRPVSRRRAALRKLIGTQKTNSRNELCAVSRDGVISCWGHSSTLRDPSLAVRQQPERLGEHPRFKQVSMLRGVGCGVTPKGQLLCWGESRHSGPGIAHRLSRTLDDELRFVSLQGSEQLLCGLTIGGKIHCKSRYSSMSLGPWKLNKNTFTEVPLPGAFRTLAVNGRNLCAVTLTGEVRCLGDSSLTRGEQKLRRFRARARSVTVGKTHACMITMDHRAFCWGRGYLGDGRNTSRPDARPVRLRGVRLTSLSAGDTHTCGISEKGGELLCWGELRVRDNSRKGTGGRGRSRYYLEHVFQRYTPAPYHPSLRNIVGLSSSKSATCAWSKDGAVRCFGTGYMGSATSPSYRSPHARPVRADLSGRAIAVARTGVSTCALREDHSVYCWGYANAEQEHRRDGGRELPRAVFLNRELRAITVFGTRPCGLDAAGIPVCATRAYEPRDEIDTLRLGVVKRDETKRRGRGAEVCTNKQDDNGDGKVDCDDPMCARRFSCAHTAAVALGAPDMTQRSTSDRRATLLSLDTRGNVFQLSYRDIPREAKRSGAHAALRRKLGIDPDPKKRAESATDRPAKTPKAAKSTKTAKKALSTRVSSKVILGALGTSGGGFGGIGLRGSSIAVGSGSGLGSAGVGGLSILGSGRGVGRIVSSSSTARKRALALPGPAKQITSGEGHHCALLRDGAVYCWGTGASGQIGDGVMFTAASPRRVMLPKKAATQLSAGASHTCALLGEEVYCWGSGSYRQLGTGVWGNSGHPARVQRLAGVAAIGAGDDHNCAVDRAGQLYCWGRNTNGQLGRAPGGSVRHPRRVDTPARFSAIAGGEAFTCALARDGKVWCWGDNSDGQLGDGTNKPHHAPAPIKSSETFTRLAAGKRHVCALATDGGVYCWGRDIKGQVSGESARSLPEPARVDFLKGKATDLSASANLSCAVLTGKKAPVCWGGRSPEFKFKPSYRLRSGNVDLSRMKNRFDGNYLRQCMNRRLGDKLPERSFKASISFTCHSYGGHHRFRRRRRYSYIRNRKATFSSKEAEKTFRYCFLYNTRLRCAPGDSGDVELDVDVTW